jgi:hypothetical protein
VAVAASAFQVEGLVGAGQEVGAGLLKSHAARPTEQVTSGLAARSRSTMATASSRAQAGSSRVNSSPP